MKLEDVQTIEQFSAFLAGTQAVAFSLAGDKASAYRWIQGLFVRFGYWSWGKRTRGL